MLQEGASPGLCFRIERERTAIVGKVPCSKRLVGGGSVDAEVEVARSRLKQTDQIP
jgi:hypothetical protein